ncbi:MAG: hypothetical protein KDC49_12495 [Saprospiraceae bacterium]|nr:hypothetical protein [Saprospiraceae bacterium]
MITKSNRRIGLTLALVVIINAFDLVSQQNADLTSLDKKSLFQGITFSKRNLCVQANALLNTFIKSYKGEDENYWKGIAQKYILPCEHQAVILSPLKYEYQPKVRSFNVGNVKQSKMGALGMDEIVEEEISVKNSSSQPVHLQLNPEVKSENLSTKLPISDTGKKETDYKTEIFSDVNTDAQKETEELSTNKNEQIINIKKDANPTISVTSKQHHFKILFAISNDGDKDFLSLADIGPVSSEQASNNAYIYYIGYYKTREAAEAVLPRVKASGYGVARIMEFNQGILQSEHADLEQTTTVSEELAKRSSPATPEKEVKQPVEVKVKEDQKTVQVAPIKEVVKSDVVSYHILFRVLNDPYQSFDELKKIGPLFRETFDDKGSTRYLVGSTTSLQEAQKLLKEVRGAGYQAAFVAEYLNGALSRVVQE